MQQRHHPNWSRFAAAAFLYQTPLPARANARIAHITPSFVTFDVFSGLVHSIEQSLCTCNLDIPKDSPTDLACSKPAISRQDGEHYRQDQGVCGPVHVFSTFAECLSDENEGLSMRWPSPKVHHPKRIKQWRLNFTNIAQKTRQRVNTTLQKDV